MDDAGLEIHKGGFADSGTLIGMLAGAQPEKALHSGIAEEGVHRTAGFAEEDVGDIDQGSTGHTEEGTAVEASKLLDGIHLHEAHSGILCSCTSISHLHKLDTFHFHILFSS